MQPLAAPIPPILHPQGPYERRQLLPEVPGMTGTRLYPDVAPGSSSEAAARGSCVALNLSPGLRLLASLTLDLCPCLMVFLSPFPSCHHLRHLTGHMDGAPTSGFFISLTSHPMAFPLYPPVLWSHCGPQHHLNYSTSQTSHSNTHLLPTSLPPSSSHPLHSSSHSQLRESSGLGFLICQLLPAFLPFLLPGGPRTTH